MIMIRKPEQLKNYETFACIPIESKNINISFMKKVTLKNSYSFIWSCLNNENGEVEQYRCSFAFNEAMASFHKYLFFTWDL